MVVGTQDLGTHVTFSPVGAVTGDPGGDPPTSPPAASTRSRWTTATWFEIYSGALGEDLTGARVSADARVAVFAGNISTSYGSNVTGINSADMAHEQMPPLSSWSKSYVRRQRRRPRRASGARRSSAGRWGVDLAGALVAGRDGGEGGRSGRPGASYLARRRRGPDAGGGRSISRSPPITRSSATQGSNCEPSLSLGIAVGATTLLTEPPVRRTARLRSAAGQSLARQRRVDPSRRRGHQRGARSSAVGVGFEVASVPLAPCVPADGSGVCTHVLVSRSQNGGFGMSLRGMDVGSSFAFTTPLVGCDPLDQGQPPRDPGRVPHPAREGLR